MSKRQQPVKKDILIPVMGATGAGKSFFINALLKEQKMVVGSDLASCTTELEFGYMETIEGYPSLKDYRVVLVDTPGFNDSFKDDFEILEKISTWLGKSYKEGSKLGGVIYLHDITAARFDGAATRNLNIFRRLCGDGALDNVILTTTKWGFKIQNSEDLQTQLITDYWKPLIVHGARVRRFDIGYDSAWSVIDAILSSAMEKHSLNQTVLQVQKELVDPQKTILDTSAGKYAASVTPKKPSRPSRVIEFVARLFGRKSFL